MLSLERHGRCRGIRITIRAFQVEVWVCPVGTKIEPHFHQTINSRIIQLWGRALWMVGDKSREVFGPFRKRESNGSITWATAWIPAGVKHSAYARSFCAFLNFERCLDGPVSASKDFVSVP